MIINKEFNMKIEYVKDFESLKILCKTLKDEINKRNKGSMEFDYKGLSIRIAKPTEDFPLIILVVIHKADGGSFTIPMGKFMKFQGLVEENEILEELTPLNEILELTSKG